MTLSDRGLSGAISHLNIGFNIFFKANTTIVPDWKLCHVTSNSTCTNENLGAHIFVQEVLGARKTNKNKVIFEWISSVVEHHDLGAKQQVCRCAFFSNECHSVGCR